MRIVRGLAIHETRGLAGGCVLRGFDSLFIVFPAHFANLSRVELRSRMRLKLHPTNASEKFAHEKVRPIN